MSSLTTPRGPLPARVYWFRRAVVLGVAFVLVFGVARVVGGGSDGDDGSDVAAQVGSDSGQATGEPTSPDAATGPTYGPTLESGRRGQRAERTEEPPAEPTGFCAPEEITLDPVVFRSTEDATVLIGLDVVTDEPACWWDVSADALTVAVTSGDDAIWSTRQCPASVPERRAVVRADEPARVVLEWSGRRADDECSNATDYALPGYYNVEAAAFSGEPTSAQFQLRPPPRPEITREPSPTEDPSAPAERPSREPARPDGPAEPTGAVEPDTVS